MQHRFPLFGVERFQVRGKGRSICHGGIIQGGGREGKKRKTTEGTEK
jgi:hypothetical protein